ncbi:CoA transferase [Anaerobacillus sp. CMMVII]|uniref:CaiB/BaiF CoA transferase family protein n=1 Tax=Anaerobacillus sp. CMMVII TaxID=2755588 RepID=UPI0021B84B5A|nr:CaiB/BaiF CoA-transferase family protein [Anaerobacillus sp. CMMVII]MCT8139198.1 CoA transferase [Anaerobacillus sp. CMMVII]
MLKGIRIIDFSLYLPGPYATLRLADLGAEVIKVEPPEGDPARLLGDKKNGTGLVFLANNRNKKSITLNLKDEKDQKLALDLIKESDVVIESFRPGVAEKLGISYEQLKKVQPQLIYCSISGYGQSGSMSTLGSHDLNYMSLSGALAQLKSETGVPVQPTNTFADLIAGIAANEAILSALIGLERTGEGCHIDLAITDVMATLMTNHLLVEQEKGKQDGIAPLGGETISYKIYETKAKRFVSLAALEKKFWINFCLGLGRDDWIDAHLSLASEKHPIFQELKQLFLTKSLEEWTQFGLTVDCCLTPILETGELSKFEYFNERGRIVDTDWGIRQILTQPQTVIEDSTPPPEKGEHREEIVNLLNSSKVLKGEMK